MVGGSVAGVDRLAWVVAADAAEGGVRSVIALSGGEVLRTSRGGLEGSLRVDLVVGDEVGEIAGAAAESSLVVASGLDWGRLPGWASMDGCSCMASRRGAAVLSSIG